MPEVKIYLTSKGCYIVRTETNHIAAYLGWNDYKIVENINEADAIVITTCAVTESAAQTTYDAILNCIRSRKNSAPIYVVGCYSRIEIERMKELAHYENIFALPEIIDIENVFLGSSSWDSVVYNDYHSHPFYHEKVKEYGRSRTAIKVIKSFFSVVDTIFNKETLFYFNFRRHLYNPEIQKNLWPVIISKGCVHSCSYCAVRIGRGKHTSKSPSSIINEIKIGIDKGYKRCLLIGDELGTYGIDLKDGTSLSSLLITLIIDEFPVSLGFWYLDCFHLTEVASQIEELCEKDKIFFLGITLQSGSERILSLMNRNYSLEKSIESIRKFRKYTKVIIATQIMVGFPTETEEDFRKSLDLINKGFFDLVEVYEYSPRPLTKAAKMNDDVPPETKAKRADKLRKVASKHKKKLFIDKVINEFRAQ